MTDVPSNPTVMIIQLHTDNHIVGREELATTVTAQLEQAFERYATRITRLEVHMQDENGARGGANDKTCMIEARLKGEDPVAVRHSADHMATALHGARDRMLHLLARHYGKQRPLKGRDPFDTVTTL
jgi:ribosome-associated translation inhibitor RaiA